MITSGIVSLALLAPFTIGGALLVQAGPAGVASIDIPSPASTETFPMYFGLPAANPDSLHAALMDVSDPTSPNYGKYYSKEQVDRLVAPDAKGVRAITDWLQKHSVDYRVASPSGDLIRADMSVETANKLFNANYTLSLHEPTNSTIVRTESYSVPPEIESHLKFIYPTTHTILPATGGPSHEVIQPPLSFLSRGSDSQNRCDAEITPKCLQKIYNIPSAPASSGESNIVVTAYLNQIATQDDLEGFTAEFRPDFQDATFSIQSIDDGPETGDPTLEASLDIQYTCGVATAVNTTLLSVGDSSINGFLDTTTYLLGLEDVPLVVSTSYGFNEPAFYNDVNLAQHLCDTYGQLGARGTTVLFSSGDGGVSGSQTTQCKDKPFVPTFPSTCPYVTSVGGTTSSAPEVAASLSSGGFSGIFQRPDYQSAAVGQYLTQLGNTYQGRFNDTGRGFPDISAQAMRFVINVNNQLRSVSGTSASTPTVASIVALLNDERLKAKKSPLGFLNPLLYQQPNLLNDVVSGSNPGCGTSGFPSVSGWDPVTGLGTPDFSKLENLP